MPRPCSMDLRERLVAAVEAGESRRSAARRFGVSAASAVKWVARARAEGRPLARRMGGYRRPALAKERSWLLARLAEKPDPTIRALVIELSDPGVKVGDWSVWAFLNAEGLSFKKTLHAAGQDRPDRARKRARWKQHQHRIDPRRLVFIDDPKGGA